MVVKEGVTRREVEEKLSQVGDYVKMDYLQQCLKKQIDFDTKKFVLGKLAEIYEQKKMLLEAGKLIRTSAEINTTYDAKTADFIRSIDLFIRAGDHFEADATVLKATSEATPKQRSEIKAKVREFYKKQADDLLIRDRRKNAMEAYEKFLSLPEISASEKYDAQQKLLGLYQKLGKVVEYGNLKKNVPAVAPAAPVEKPSVMQMPSVPAQEPKKGFFARLFG